MNIHFMHPHETSPHVYVGNLQIERPFPVITEQSWERTLQWPDDYIMRGVCALKSFSQTITAMYPVWAAIAMSLCYETCSLYPNLTPCCWSCFLHVLSPTLAYFYQCLIIIQKFTYIKLKCKNQNELADRIRDGSHSTCTQTRIERMTMCKPTILCLSQSWWLLEKM